jgi:hypothetical protein
LKNNLHKGLLQSCKDELKKKSERKKEVRNMFLSFILAFLLMAISSKVSFFIWSSGIIVLIAAYFDFSISKKLKTLEETIDVLTSEEEMVKDLFTTK